MTTVVSRYRLYIRVVSPNEELKISGWFDDQDQHKVWDDVLNPGRYTVPVEVR